MKTKKLVLTAFFTVLIILCTYLRIPMFPVPITMQALATTLAGIILGAKWGTASVLMYIALGLFGLPVFSCGGGFSCVFNPSFGFLPGFVVSTYVVGRLCDAKQFLSSVKLMIYSYISFIPMYFIGICYYYFVLRLYMGENTELFNIIFACYIVFIPGDILKCILCGFFGEKIRKAVKF